MNAVRRVRAVRYPEEGPLGTNRGDLPRVALKELVESHDAEIRSDRVIDIHECEEMVERREPCAAAHYLSALDKLGQGTCRFSLSMCQGFAGVFVDNVPSASAMRGAVQPFIEASVD